MLDTENRRVYPRIVAVAEEENCYQIATMRIQNNPKQTKPILAKLLKPPNNPKQIE